MCESSTMYLYQMYVHFISYFQKLKKNYMKSIKQIIDITSVHIINVIVDLIRFYIVK